MHVSVWVYAFFGCPRTQEWMLLELESQVVMSQVMWGLGIELTSSGRVMRALNH